MPQQINLCIPILLKEKRYFSAQTMAQAIGVLGLVGGSLLTYWVWSLNASSEGFKTTLTLQAQELEGLEAALKQGKAGAGSAETALTQELQVTRTALQQREKLLAQLQLGLLRPGWGHSARLQLLAQSIPAQVWVTEMKADDSQLDIRGFTLEPAALNTWVGKLAVSPLLKDQVLATVKVESATAAAAMIKASAPVAGSSRPVWSFNLVNAVNKPASVTGGKP